MSEALPNVLLSLMRDTGIPNGLSDLGYSGDDIPTLVEGTLKQSRLLVNCPRRAEGDDLRSVIEQSFEYW